ncbi:hypothetical protein OUZ56_008345 [Daphnia magna]|uniref:Uncharacterized protein n=1 Tax=Daphnia magna TaxID=35525 RepID=A0ABR0ACP3_9CRUS|nr:hypothetical protein OUZ56_008345 [Daphnia magna]
MDQEELRLRKKVRKSSHPLLNSTATPGSLDPSWHGSIIILTLAALSRFHDLNIYQMNGGDGGEVEENRGEPKVSIPNMTMYIVTKSNG